MIKEFENKTNLELLAYRPVILTHRIDYRNGLRLKNLADVYLISKMADGTFNLLNTRTGHTLDLPSRLLERFTRDPLNNAFGLHRGVLTIKGEWWQSGDHAWIRPRRPPTSGRLRRAV